MEDLPDVFNDIITRKIDLFPLTHFSPMFHFYTPWKRPKTKGFWTFSEGIEMKH